MAQKLVLGDEIHTTQRADADATREETAERALLDTNYRFAQLPEDLQLINAPWMKRGRAARKTHEAATPKTRQVSLFGRPKQTPSPKPSSCRSDTTPPATMPPGDKPEEPNNNTPSLLDVDFSSLGTTEADQQCVDVDGLSAAMDRTGCSQEKSDGEKCEAFSSTIQDREATRE